MPVICLASPKGGVGKTTLSANLAHALHRAGRRVLAIDLDPQNALRLHYGVPLEETGGFMAGLMAGAGAVPPPRETAAGVALLPHGTLDMAGSLTLAAALDREPERLAAPLRQLMADPGLVIVIDTPPGPSQALAAVIPLVDTFIAVLLADAASTALLPQVETGGFLGQGTLASLFSSRLRIVINQVDPASRLSMNAAEAVARHLGPKLLGAVARDEAMAEALAYQRLLLDFAPASRAAGDLGAIARATLALLPPPVPAAPPASSGRPPLLDPARWGQRSW
ncbi:MAG TPA: cellulose biosynthesis protein BcsQ [Roseomonas sp.]|jgi:cellulose synthase operon protein YhjQ